MSSLENENNIYTVPDGSRIGPRVDKIVVREGIFDVFTVNNINMSDPNNGLMLAGLKFRSNLNNVKTVDATTAYLFNFTLPPNNGGIYLMRLVATDFAGNITTYKSSIKIKNVAGAITIGNPYDVWQDCDSSLNGITVNYVTNDPNILLIQVTGIMGKTIVYSGILEELCVPIC